MPLQKHSELAQTSVYTFYDDSRHASVVLGPGFSLPKHPAWQASSPTGRAHDVWEAVSPVFTVRTESLLSGDNQWHVSFEECTAFPKRFRAVVRNAVDAETHSYEVKDDFSIEYAPDDVMSAVPESVFGWVLGGGVGATEAKNMVLSRLRRRMEMEKGGNGAETSRNDWRAPRFSFTLRTATGSPFAERWGFAIQEAVAARNGFRIWIEQQRTGREVYLRLRPDGSIEGMHELEQLPAAVHGAGLGMVLGFHHITRRMDDLTREAANESVSQQDMKRSPVLQPVYHESRIRRPGE